MRRTLAAAAVAAVVSPSAHASCVEPGEASSLAEIVRRVQAEGIRYVFIGERHGVGPIKKLAVDLANALIESGLSVGLYVEGFRTDCAPQDTTCWSLARAFNMLAFRTLLDESDATVHAIDPPEGKGRAAKMAAIITAGSEAVRVALVGKSHVLYAGDGEAVIWSYGGALQFPDPGDVVERFPPPEVLTLGLEVSHDIDTPYALRVSGCGADYIVMTQDTGRYWGVLAAATPTVGEESGPDAAPAAEAIDAEVAVVSSG